MLTKNIFSRVIYILINVKTDYHVFPALFQFFQSYSVEIVPSKNWCVMLFCSRSHIPIFLMYFLEWKDLLRFMHILNIWISEDLGARTKVLLNWGKVHVWNLRTSPSLLFTHLYQFLYSNEVFTICTFCGKFNAERHKIDTIETTVFITCQFIHA